MMSLIKAVSISLTLALLAVVALLAVRQNLMFSAVILGAVAIIAFYVCLGYRKWLDESRSVIVLSAAFILLFLWMKQSILPSLSADSPLMLISGLVAVMLGIGFLVSTIILVFRSKANWLFISIVWLAVPPIVLSFTQSSEGTSYLAATSPAEKLLWLCLTIWSRALIALGLIFFMVYALYELAVKALRIGRK